MSISEMDYHNYISLGYFCGVAQDLEKLGLRSQSSPFDWGISSFEGVIRAIDTRFEDFLKFENLSQSINIRSHYRDNRYDFYFFHDFDKSISLAKQYENVKTKYDRRIERFLNTIISPTLFIRYISSEKVASDGKSLELTWIEENIDYIIAVIKKYNANNDIIFIGDESIVSKVISVYNVKRDTNDTVARSPIMMNEDLLSEISKISFPERQLNIDRYLQKERIKNEKTRKNELLNKRRTIIWRVFDKIRREFRKTFFKDYLHEFTYDIPNM